MPSLYISICIYISIYLCISLSIYLSIHGYTPMSADRPIYLFVSVLLCTFEYFVFNSNVTSIRSIIIHHTWYKWYMALVSVPALPLSQDLNAVHHWQNDWCFAVSLDMYTGKNNLTYFQAFWCTYSAHFGRYVLAKVTYSKSSSFKLLTYLTACYLLPVALDMVCT